MGNLDFIELITLAVAGFFAFDDGSRVPTTTAALLMGGVILLMFVLGDAEDSPFNLQLTAGGIDFTLVAVCGAILYFIYRAGKQGQSARLLWVALAIILFLSASSSTSLF